MPTRISVTAKMDSAYELEFTFAELTPTTLKWSLLSTDGTIINSREDISVTPASTVTIILSGDDLAVTSGDFAARLVRLEGTYTSGSSTLPFKQDFQFVIEG